MFSISTLILLLSTGTWVGTILFQSAVVAPSVFAALDEAAARRFLRRLFPRFFRLGSALSIVALAAAIVAGLASGWPPPQRLVIALTAGMAILAVVALAMIPAINAARDAGEAGAARFTALHRLNVLATIAMLVLGIVVVSLVALDAPAAH